MLPDDDRRVVEAFQQLELRKMAEDDIKASLTHGASWPKSHSKHQEARKQLGERLQLEAGQRRERFQFCLVRSGRGVVAQQFNLPGAFGARAV